MKDTVKNQLDQLAVAAKKMDAETMAKLKAEGWPTEWREYLHDVGFGKDTGVKYDNEKIQMELLPLRELQEVARVLTYGAKKYSPDNWKKVPDMKERYTGALLRHLTAYRQGITFDHETNPNPQRHIAQVVCNALFLLWKELEDENTKISSLPDPKPNDEIPFDVQVLQVVKQIFGEGSEEDLLVSRVFQRILYHKGLEKVGETVNAQYKG